jgi:hypothetical protein
MGSLGGLGDIPPGWLTLIGLAVTTVVGAVGALFRYQQAQISAADERADLYAEKYEALLNKWVEEARDQRDALLERAEVDRKQVTATTDTNAVVLKLAAALQSLPGQVKQ